MLGMQMDNVFGDGLQTSARAVSSEDCRHLSGDMVNVDLVAPGALTALAFMYLQTENERLAARLAVPEAVADLDFLRPQLALWRIVCRLVGTSLLSQFFFS